MRRLSLILLCPLLMLSCSVLKHEGKSFSEDYSTDGYARDYFYLEGARQFDLGNYDAAMDLYRHTLDIDTATAAACYNLAQFYMSFRDRATSQRYASKADELLSRAVRLEPDNYWYRRLLAMNMQRMNRVDDAIAQYEEMARRFPGRTDLLLTLAALYDDAGDYGKELRVLTRYGQIEDVADELKMQRVACYLELGELDSAFVESDNPEQIIDLLTNSVSGSLDHMETDMDRLSVRSMIEMLASFCDVAIRYEPGMASAWKSKAMTCFWMGERQQGLDALTQGLENVSDAEGKSMLFSFRGDYYNSLGEKQKMYADYDSTLVYDPDNIPVLNNYAYFMSVENRDLKKALEMSGKTIKAEPLNPTYLDTYAWILFRMKKYEEAKSYMERALQYMDDENSDLYEHYGDVLFMCGDVDGAVENWHRALQLNSSSAVLEQKIKERKYLE